MEKNGRPPVIIIGMHRSGTGMLTRMLENLGLFVGERNSIDHEALFFQNINEWLLHQCGAAWDYPQPFNLLMTNKELRINAVNYIHFLLKSPFVISFLGLKKYLKYRSPLNLDMPWGWKDPRNTYTLPFWTDIFPNAKVIHIYRHGVDVANSLKIRHERSIKQLSKSNFINIKKLFYWTRRQKLLCFTLRCALLEGGICLWEEYLHQARNHIDHFKQRSIEVKFEDFLVEPYETLKSLSHFCELSVKESAVKNAAEKVQKSRAYAYLSDRKLRYFADNIADRLSIFGY